MPGVYAGPATTPEAKAMLSITTRLDRRESSISAGLVPMSWRTTTASAVFEREVRAVPPHGNPNVGSGQGRGVVDAVADDQDEWPSAFKVAYRGNLGLREQPCAHVGDGLRRAVGRLSIDPDMAEPAPQLARQRPGEYDQRDARHEDEN
jgi:hypothetical protein